MTDVRHALEGDTLVINVAGRFDTTTSSEIVQEIDRARATCRHGELVLDLDGLEAISSVGLRAVLRLIKEERRMQIDNASLQVYETLEMTGFTELVKVHRAYHRVSVEGCEVIGSGANGKVYRLGSDIIVKVYDNPDSLPEIRRERELARMAFVAGIPTAIPYDVVRVGEGYGSVFELLEARSYGQLLASGEKTVEEIAQMAATLLRQIHATMIESELLPSMREVALGWIDILEGHLSPVAVTKVRSLVASVPDDPHLLHGDYHIKNIMMQDGESLLIDMDTLCHGHPVFELGSVFNACVGFGWAGEDVVESFMGISYETSCKLWHEMLRRYLGTDDEQVLRSVEEKATLVGCLRLMRHPIDHGTAETAEGRRRIELYRARIEELVPKIDTLLF